ncbi:MAG: tRNA (adenosine(37)-N6)-threonylcarbamoyltransferase complex transferase subunit TsaD [Chthoniobacterales bacterium]|nr:tRNA (adenosine(37)-N6)-threonylcarbamoyltransferase complex transferase subunit TsaD [Chthoniobacterales bacterium]
MNFSKPILAIESSCDETAVAILQPPSQLLASLIASQVKKHAIFGGVVPEVASRQHLSDMDPLFHQVLKEAKLTPTDLGAVVATTGPGLAPALLVGASYAKGVALGLGVPYLGVNHLEGHLLSPFFGETIIPRHLSLLVSGGHTQLTEVIQAGNYCSLGRTQDDAAGEAFDKVAKLLGLPYPGGIVIDRLASQGDPKRYFFPRALMEKGNLDFSFSGLKTAVRYFLEKRTNGEEGLKLESQELADICASFQEAVVAVLLEKARRAAEERDLDCIALSGGVAANSALRRELKKLCETQGWRLCLAPLELTGDNAAMIAFAGWHRLLLGERGSVTEEIRPQWQIV